MVGRGKVMQHEGIELPGAIRRLIGIDLAYLISKCEEGRGSVATWHEGLTH